MAAGEPDQPQQVEALIDELILEILDHAEQGQPAKAAGRVHAALPGGLLDGVRATMARSSGGPMLERLLVAEALAGVLADALAPALAEALAPRIMKVLEGEEPAAGTEPPAKTPAGRSRKSDSK
ncbi:hypothetical protein Daura_48790 [Dactylosporangium aurantiacum]|uniref:Uncharacterized protein n=1 Tax=Dactylosporangium aurantiacum TaxID=35754 RepID=A0A9Q9IF49_9ACTN|nr:hypothetical protein [Dactylosporangium aurantiacum]MDG6107483.1 hypothetical protein [Dactylosporangium aurantiacum]UWZ54276.1 hypothetical protein Daura_48790 [Dactylosporangium aurantiacum]